MFGDPVRGRGGRRCCVVCGLFGQGGIGGVSHSEDDWHRAGGDGGYDSPVVEDGDVACVSAASDDEDDVGRGKPSDCRRYGGDGVGSADRDADLGRMDVEASEHFEDVGAGGVSGAGGDEAKRLAWFGVQVEGFLVGA